MGRNPFLSIVCHVLAQSVCADRNNNATNRLTRFPVFFFHRGPSTTFEESYPLERWGTFTEQCMFFIPGILGCRLAGQLGIQTPLPPKPLAQHLLQIWCSWQQTGRTTWKTDFLTRRQQNIVKIVVRNTSGLSFSHLLGPLAGHGGNLRDTGSRTSCDWFPRRSLW